MGMKGPGRPTPQQQEEIARKIKPYYEMGLSARYTAQQPNMPNLETIQNYFREWKEKHLEEEAPDISERQKEVKSQFIVVYDRLLFNLNAQLNKVVGLIQKHEKQYNDAIEKLKTQKVDPADWPEYKPNQFLENKFTNLCKLIGDMISAKASVEVAAYANETTYQAVLNKMQEEYEKTSKSKESKKVKKT